MFYLACIIKSGTVFTWCYIWNVCCVVSFSRAQLQIFSMFCTLPASDDNEYYNFSVVLNQSCQDLSVSQIVLDTSNPAVLKQVLVFIVILKSNFILHC